jgi:hypothetical protein
LFSTAKAFPQAPFPSSDPELHRVSLRDGTLVKLKLLHRLYSKVVVVDDPVNFVVAEDVIQDGEVVILAGSPAIGRVRNAKPARTLGRGAQLGLEIQYAKVGTTRIPLRGTALKSGEGKQAETVAIVVLFGVSGLIKHGSEIEIPEGEIFNAYVDQDVAVILKKPGMQTQSGE